MIKKFVKAWEEKKHLVRAVFEAAHPGSYLEVVRAVVEIMPEMDAERIHAIDDGHYQGTLIFVIPEEGYQPSSYWFVKVDYGSCSGCDTLERIRNYCDEKPTPEQVDDYMTLALHIVQRLKSMQEGDE